ncbi:MAG: VOC family protein [Xanthobacteraceae bacterium]|nr:VOC family protein [Xanthobacteraceae bacterium]
MADAKPQLTWDLTWDHIHIRTPDPEATARWFADMLGAEIVPTPARIDVRLGGNSIFVSSAVEGDNPPPVTPCQGLDHFGLAVRGLDALVADLKAKGVAFTRDVHELRPGLRICFIRGPQGISIELLERT